MKLVNLIDYLINPSRLNKLYKEENINCDTEALLIYMEEKLDIDSNIEFFTIEETEDNLIYKKNNINYFQLFPVEHAVELIESDLNLKGKELSNLQIANRLLEYRIKDA
jgi:hypothetical protein